MSNKTKAHMGDALINFFARELMANDKTFHRCDQVSQSNRMTSNNFLKQVCLKYGGFDECCGTNYEAKVYEIYLDGGLVKAYKYFKETVYDHWESKVAEGKVHRSRPNHCAIKINHHAENKH